MSLAEQVASVLNTSECLETINLRMYSYYKDGDEGDLILNALSSGPSLATITNFDCSYNYQWFVEGKESNLERLTDAIRCMTALREVSLRWISLPDSAACDQLMEALIDN